MNEIGRIGPRTARRSPRHRVLFVIAPFAIAGVAAIWFVVRPGAPVTQFRPPEAAPLVTTVAVQRRPMPRSLSVEGTLVARHELAIGTETAASRIEAVLADEGDLVVKGQVLVRLDTAVLQAQLRHAEATAEDAAASAASTAADFRRADGIRGTGAVSAEQLDGRRAAARSAAARLAAAQAEVGELRTRIAEADVHAPADGVIVARNAEPGAITPAGGAPLFRLDEGGLVEFDARVPQDALQALAPGLTVELRIGAPGEETPIKGRIRAIAPTLDPRSRLGVVHVRLPLNPRLRPGAFAQGRILLSRMDALSLPRSAILSRDGESFVYLIDGGQARRRVVTTGAMEAGQVEIREGLTAGDHIVLAAGAFLHDGQTVRETPADSEPPVRTETPAGSGVSAGLGKQ
jgi:RND family efflux transporter MFP subunit